MRLAILSRMTSAVLMLAAGCAATQPEVGMEAPGRPAVTWHSEATSTSPMPGANSDTATERRLLAELSKQQGPDTLVTAETLYNLAILRRRQGASMEAERLYRRALAIREREQGPSHPDVAVILNNLAALAATEGRYQDALPLLERALSIRQTALGNTHVLTAESLNNLALLYAAQGDTAAAEPLYTQAVAILEPAEPPSDHPQIRAASQSDPRSGDRPGGELARVLDNYAALLHDTGRDAEADELAARARALQAGNPSGPVH